MRGGERGLSGDSRTASGGHRAPGALGTAGESDSGRCVGCRLGLFYLEMKHKVEAVNQIGRNPEATNKVLPGAQEVKRVLTASPQAPLHQPRQ